MSSTFWITAVYCTKGVKQSLYLSDQTSFQSINEIIKNSPGQRPGCRVHCHQAFCTNIIQPMEDSGKGVISLFASMNVIPCTVVIIWQYIIRISTLFNNTKSQIFTYTGHRSKQKQQGLGRPGQQPPMHYKQRTNLI